MSLTATLNINARADLAATDGFVTPSARIALDYGIQLASGTGTGQANGVHSERYTLGISGTQVIDLSAIVDDLGQNVAFTAIKYVAIKAASSNVAHVNLRPNTTEGWTAPFNAAADTIKLEAGGFAVLANPAAAGWAVVNNTTDKLLLTNTSGAASAVIDVVIVGVGTIT
jgi:hypothetical protein